MAFILHLVNGTNVKYSFAPQLKGFYRNEDYFKLLLDMYKVRQLITGNLTIQ